jgi:hypothetical protein
MRERKALSVRVKVMELQGGDAAVVSAHPTAAARLSYKDSLDLPPSLGYTFLGATPAPIVPLPSSRKRAGPWRGHVIWTSLGESGGSDGFRRRSERSIPQRSSQWRTVAIDRSTASAISRKLRPS